MGGRGILKGEILNAGCILNSEEQTTALAIENMAFLDFLVEIENKINDR
jgi:hypothetical protein